MKKKIIFFLQNFIAGGAEKNIINYANFLSKNNIEVYILTINNLGVLKKKVDKKVKIISLNKKRLLFSTINIFQIIKKLNPDFLFSSLLHISLFLAILKKFKVFNSKLIIRPSNIMYNNSSSNNKIKKIIFNFLTKKYLKHGDIFLSISEEIYKELKFLKINSNKIKKIKNAIIDENFYKSSITPLKNKFLQKKDYLLAIGRLTEQKNHLMLINAFTLIKKKYNKNLYLVIIGEGSLKNKYEALIEKNKLKDKVLILKNMSEVKNYIHYSKLFIQTSLWEGQPNVLFEAIILNKRVITTKCPGQSSFYLAKYKNCHLLKTNTVKELAKSILYFLRKKNKFNFSKKTYEEFRIENSGKKILNEIKKN